MYYHKNLPNSSYYTMVATGMTDDLCSCFINILSSWSCVQIWHLIMLSKFLIILKVNDFLCMDGYYYFTNNYTIVIIITNRN